MHALAPFLRSSLIMFLLTLHSFKKGAFQMAKAAGVKIIPVSIGNLHRSERKQTIKQSSTI
jgi:hypothetical protein